MGLHPHLAPAPENSDKALNPNAFTLLTLCIYDKTSLWQY
jgi:hypothetical protein